MRKILVLTEKYYPEEFLINELVEEWNKNDFEVTVVTLVPTYPYGQVFNGYKNKLYSKELFENIIIKRFKAVTGYRENKILKALSFFNYVFFASFYVVFFGWKYDHVFVYQVGALTVGIPGIISKVYKKKITIWSQDIWPDSVFPKGFNGIYKVFVLFVLKIIVKIVYGNVDNIIVSCRPFIDIINKYVDRKKIYYFPNWAAAINNGSDLSVIKLSDKINITFAGNITRWRNLDVIMRAFHRCNSADKKAQLNIVGDGSGLEYLKNIKNTEGFEDVFFFGRVSSEIINKYYDASDILLISLAPNPCYSLYLPAKFSSYLATGKPILAIMNGAVPELMSQYYVGIVANPDNKDEIEKAILQIIDMSKGEKEKISNESKRLLNDHFDKVRIIAGITKCVNG